MVVVVEVVLSGEHTDILTIWHIKKSFFSLTFYPNSTSGYLNLGYSTPFLSLGASYMYSSLAAAKAAVISVSEEIATIGLPSGISPIVFVFTGSGNGMFFKSDAYAYFCTGSLLLSCIVGPPTNILNILRKQ